VEVSRTPRVTVPYVAAMLCKDHDYVLRLIRAGVFQAHKQTGKLNARWLIDKGSFEAWLASTERGYNE